MAILLIMDRNKYNMLDAAKDSACYKRGDIVEVFDDDKPCVIPPAEPFYLIKINGLKREDALKYIEPQWDSTSKAVPVMLTRRLYNLPVDLLPRDVAEKIKRERYIEIEWSEVRPYITNKVTLMGE